MKKYLIGLFLFLTTGMVFAKIDHFVVQVSPNSISKNEPVDLTIKAVDAGGNAVKDYEGDIIIEVRDEKYTPVNEQEVTLPNDGFYIFVPDDQGSKTFSKGLILKNEGKFTVIAAELADDKIKGEQTIQVGGHAAAAVSGSIQIISPIVGSTEEKAAVDLIAKSSLPNSPFEVELDGKKTNDGLTDPNGDINSSLTDLTSGDHSFIIKILDIDGKILSQSTETKFKYKGTDDNYFKSISILPSNVINKGEPITINLKTVEKASSVEISLESNSYPMTKQKDGEFKYEMVMDKAGEYKVSAKITVDGNPKSYPNIEKITINEKVVAVVTEKKSIGEIKAQLNQDKTKIELEWKYNGQIPKFQVIYGTGKEALTNKLESTTNKAVIEKINPLVIYFIQILPLNAEGSVDGEASQIISVEPNMKAAASCSIKGIKVETQPENGKFYLVWKLVPGSKKYNIYKSENESNSISNMNLVGTTVENKFEYPFDPHAKKDIYNYYAVEAECEDGTKVQVDTMKKVHVGPMDTLFMFIIISAIIYFSSILYGYSKH